MRDTKALELCVAGSTSHTPNEETAFHAVDRRLVPAFGCEALVAHVPLMRRDTSHVRDFSSLPSLPPFLVSCCETATRSHCQTETATKTEAAHVWTNKYAHKVGDIHSNGT